MKEQHLQQMTKHKSISMKNTNWPALLIVLFTLNVFPLVMHDHYFDINRFKVRCLMIAVVSLFPFWLLRPDWILEFIKRLMHDRRILELYSVLGFFLCLCTLSAARFKWNNAILWGNDGRYSGLFLILTCSAVFLMSSTLHTGNTHLWRIIRITTLIVSLLGILNTMGRDPIGFYIGIKKGQEDYFVSTIGNTDFFGAWIAMMYPLTTGENLRNGNDLYSMATLILTAFIMSIGTVASRSDCAFGAMLIICLLRIALTGDDWRQMARANLLCAILWISFPIMRGLLFYGWFDIRLKGVAAFICKSHIGILLSVFHTWACAICFKTKQTGTSPLGRKKMIRVLAFLCLSCILLSLILIFYFTCVNQTHELGFAEDLLRFNDSWGSRRGFIWARALRAFSDFSLADKLFGKGLDTAQRILTPYFDKPSMLSYGVFNDTHNQILQYLVTTGLFGAIALVVFHLNLIRLAYHRIDINPVCTDDLAMLCGYSLIAFLSVSQPILLATYACLAGLAVSHSLSEGELYES